jgi:Tfp pilus assembly protein PilF
MHTARATRRATHHLAIALLAAIATARGLAPSGARASEESVFLYSEGLEEFRTKTDDYRAALVLFEQSVAKDPNDVAARYYRGVTRARLGQVDGAVEDLTWVVQQRPGFDRAALELGIVLVGDGRYAEALPWLHQAQVAPDLAPSASFYIGIADLHLGWLDQARAAFEQASAPGAPADLALPTRYYLGLVAAGQGRTDEARSEFAAVAEARPDTDMGRAAAEYLAGSGAAPALAWEVHGFAKLEYDSNAVLAPSDSATSNALAIGRESDGRTRLGVGASLAPWRTENAELRLGYDFDQIVYFHLSEFDLQEHRPRVQIAARSGPWAFGLVGRYDYDLLEATSFLQQAAAQPWVRFAEGELGRTELFYQARWRDFFQQRYSPSLDAWNNAASLTQFFYLDGAQRYLWIGYQFDRNQGLYSQGDPFSYDGNEANAGVGFQFASVGAGALLGYRYRHESFDAASLGRRDDENAVTLQLQKSLTRNVLLTLEYFGTFHDSNQAVFSYDRQIGSIGLEVQF